MSVFSQQGYLRREVSLDPVKAMLEQKWDRSRQPTPWAVIPGLFIQERPSIGKQQMVALLASADPSSLKTMARAVIASRNGDARLIEAIENADQTQGQTIVTAIVSSLACDRDCEIAADLFSSPSTWPSLASLFHGRYGLAVQAIGAATRFHNVSEQTFRPTILAFLLAAVIDMSGGPDDD